MSEGILLRLRDYVFVACCPRQPQICGAIHGAHIAIQSSLHQYTSIQTYPEFTFWGHFSGIWDPTFLAPIYVPVSEFPPCHLVAKIQRHLREFCPSSDLFFFPFSLPSAIDLDVVTIVLSRVAVTFLLLTACFVKTSNSDLGEKCFHLFGVWCCSSCFQ